MLRSTKSVAQENKRDLEKPTRLTLMIQILKVSESCLRGPPRTSKRFLTTKTRSTIEKRWNVSFFYRRVRLVGKTGSTGSRNVRLYVR